MSTSATSHRSTSAPAIEAPNAFLMLLEGRAPWELAATVAASPWLRRLPKGDGHPVLVFPGLGANDLSTAALRTFLKERGYAAYPWKQGFNLGPRDGVLQRCRDEADALFRLHQRPVSLIGWSLGGIYAREVAKLLPEQTRFVITLGTPFAGHPSATNAWRFYRLVSGHKDHDPALIEQVRKPPPVPTTSIYSRSDGIVAWQCSLNEPGPRVENIEVPASHIGMGLNPITLFAIGDRLGQDAARWRPFEADGLRRWFYRTGVAG